MQIVDLTQAYFYDFIGAAAFPNMYNYEFRIKSIGHSITIGKQTFQYLSSIINLETHAGTHIDFPSSLLLAGKEPQDYDISDFICEALTVEFKKGENEYITGEEMIEKLKEVPSLKDKALLIKTGFGKFWKTDPEKYYNSFPQIGKECAEIIANFGLGALGIDCPSLDMPDYPPSFPYVVDEGAEGFLQPIKDPKATNHLILLNANCIIIQNLNLEKIRDMESFTLCFPPLRVEAVDKMAAKAISITALPCRAFAIKT
ncbi:MAG: cyclase family protein [Candidatus Jordarchaeum sp.]|uniref:cyclase family protein n=1 Tax=Candidatus Jordarchaeum sp. TaxID=2823881 RepID=UPI004048FE01